MRKFFLLPLIVCSPAMAEDQPDCAKDPAEMAQMEMNYCSYQAYLQEDAKLNAVWKKVKVVVTQMDADTEAGKTEAMDALVSGQRGWIAYRDGECVIAGFEAYGGSMQPMLVNSCLEEKTKARTKELKDFLERPDQ